MANKFKVGDIVEHRAYKKGVIKRLDPINFSFYWVIFDSGGNGAWCHEGNLKAVTTNISTCITTITQRFKPSDLVYSNLNKTDCTIISVLPNNMSYEVKYPNFNFGQEFEIDLISMASRIQQSFNTSNQPIAKFKVGDKVIVNSKYSGTPNITSLTGCIVNIVKNSKTKTIYEVDYGSQIGVVNLFEHELDLAILNISSSLITSSYSYNDVSPIIGVYYASPNSHASKVPCCECGAHK